MSRRTKRVAASLTALGILLATGLCALYAFTPNYSHPRTVEGRPLLEQDGRLFTDTQINLQFLPPEGWALQARSTESPTTHKPERMVVKYKRLVRGPKVAWLRVSVGDVPNDESPAELLRTRKPREAGWQPVKDVEDGLAVGGRPAARVTFAGMLDPDGKGGRHCTAEVTAVRQGAQAIYFAGTFTTTDAEAREMIRAAVESAVFDRDRFAAR